MSSSLVAKKPGGSFKQIIRYALVGIVSNLAGYLVYLLVTYLGGTPKITMSILYGLGAAIGYIGNRNYTFADNGNWLGSGVRYFISHILGYSINLVILVVFADQYGYAHQWVQAVAIFVVAGFLFITFKYFVFTNLNEFSADRK